MGMGNGAPWRSRVNATALIDTVFAGSRAKQLQNAMQCSPRQARRIVQTGRVPPKLWLAFVQVVRNQSAANARHMEAISLKMKAIEHEEMVARAKARRAADMGQDTQDDYRLRGRTKDFAVKD